MKVGVVKETFAGERRVALVPSSLRSLTRAKLDVMIESGAGLAAGFADQAYCDQGAALGSRDQVFAQSDVVLQVRALGANQDLGRQDLPRMRPGQWLIGMCDPLGEPAAVREVARTGASLAALELIPRITRAQSMDVLSSMATIAGYRAVLLAAVELSKMFPLLMTAAGTIVPAKAFVIGAGVAGLQAISTARRLGAVVQAYDIRPTVGEQVESLGAKFVQLSLDTAQSEDKGGYAKELSEEFYQRQRQLMAQVVAESDVVITTAAIPGKLSPRLITREAVEGMRPGSVIVDLAAERGGNCELSRPDQRIVHCGVVILGPTNLPADVARDASQMYSKNITTYLLSAVKDGELRLSRDDEVIRETLVAHHGETIHPRLRELLGLPPLEQAVAKPSTDDPVTTHV